MSNNLNIIDRLTFIKMIRYLKVFSHARIGRVNQQKVFYSMNCSIQRIRVRPDVKSLNHVTRHGHFLDLRTF